MRTFRLFLKSLTGTLAFLVILIGEFLYLSAQRENTFFSSVMRIQKERGHTVCDTGIYRIVRHPGYLRNIITAIGIPLVLGSLWSYLPVLAAIFLALIRTSLEDRTLRNEL